MKLLHFTYVWIYENEAKRLISCTKRASVFFLARNKGDDIKIKRIVGPFFLPLPCYLAFTAVLSLCLAHFHGFEVALEFRELKVKKEFKGQSS